jgi:hypothetical protein
MASTSALATSPSANLASLGKVALTKGLGCFLGNSPTVALRSAGSTRDLPDPQTGLGCSATKLREDRKLMPPRLTFAFLAGLRALTTLTS